MKQQVEVWRAQLVYYYCYHSRTITCWKYYYS